MKSYLFFETLLLASDKCLDLYWSIGRLYLKEKSFWKTEEKFDLGLVTKEIWLGITGIRMCLINSLFIIFQPEVLDLLPV